MSNGDGKCLHLSKKDFTVEWYSGQGPGGQHRNKHQNCCRITHIESGLRAQGTEARERSVNQRVAFNRLAQLVVDHYLPGNKKARYNAKEVIRNYNEPRNDVLDKKSGLRQPYSRVVVNGDLSDMIEARRFAILSDEDVC